MLELAYARRNCLHDPARLPTRAVFMGVMMFARQQPLLNQCQ
jgi:hypothetical protein